MVKAVQDVGAFPIAAGADVIGLFEEGSVAAEDLVDFGFAPYIEFAFLALAVGIERGGDASLGEKHFALEPFNRFAHAAGVKRFARFLPDARIKLDELGIVVEHLFEMRDEPAFIHRIACEAAPQMIVDAALGHVVEHARRGRFEGMAVRGRGAAQMRPPEEGENPGLGKFRRALEAAIFRVHQLDEFAGHKVGDLRGGFAGS